MTRIYLPILTLLLCLAACTDDLARTDTPQPGPGEGLISLSLPGIVYDNAFRLIVQAAAIAHFGTAVLNNTEVRYV